MGEEYEEENGEQDSRSFDNEVPKAAIEYNLQDVFLPPDIKELAFDKQTFSQMMFERHVPRAVARARWREYNEQLLDKLESVKQEKEVEADQQEIGLEDGSVLTPRLAQQLLDRERLDPKSPLNPMNDDFIPPDIKNRYLAYQEKLLRVVLQGKEQNNFKSASGRRYPDDVSNDPNHSIGWGNEKQFKSAYGGRIEDVGSEESE